MAARRLRVVKIRQEINGSLVGILKDLLAEAKAGKIQTIAYVAECSDNSIQAGATNKKDQARVIGALARLQFRLCREMD